MNIVDLFARRDKSCTFPPGATPFKKRWAGAIWRGLTIPIGLAHALRLKDFERSHPIWSRPDTLGWYVATQRGEADLHLVFSRGQTVVSATKQVISEAPVPVLIQWPETPANPKLDLELSLHASGDDDNIDIYVQQVLSREILYELTTGVGVEIGPGPVPQIKNNNATSVSYIEETSPENWAILYDKTGKFGAKNADWSKIIIGKACDLPFDDSSLDFIFSSHVFEHLANPLGHLEYWLGKLKKGGVVLAIVPDMAATKDRYMRPSSMAELRNEHAAADFDVRKHHYERFTQRFEKGVVNPRYAEELIERKESIHVHYYDNCLMSDIIEESINTIGYSSGSLLFRRNHKDFYLILKK